MGELWEVSQLIFFAFLARLPQPIGLEKKRGHGRSRAIDGI